MSERTIIIHLGRAPEQMRYKTAGDWTETKDGYEIIAVDCGDPRYAKLLALHEFIEVLLCDEGHVTADQVDAYDLAHQDDDDPGLNSDAPYHNQHMTAFAVEILVAKALGVEWSVYNKALDDAWERIPEKKPEGES